MYKIFSALGPTPSNTHQYSTENCVEFRVCLHSSQTKYSPVRISNLFIKNSPVSVNIRIILVPGWFLLHFLSKQKLILIKIYYHNIHWLLEMPEEFNLSFSMFFSNSFKETFVFLLPLLWLIIYDIISYQI